VEIIPVIDVMAGQVVHALRGQRQAYEPIKSPLSPDPCPISVVRGLLQLGNFKTVYVADLDALMGLSPQTAAIQHLAAAFPHLHFWMDHGLPPMQRETDFTCEQVVSVIGSESMTEKTLVELDLTGRPYILSLDFRDGQLVGPGSILKTVDLWPGRVILMNLSRVGSFDGPDFSEAARFIERYPEHHFVSAGGIRHGRDLDELLEIGVTAVLVASALHTGAIGRDTLNRFNLGE
jgi:phosphoribosylformimino-5-aminoimidazole carboxamide ribotide isomerase